MKRPQLPAFARILRVEDVRRGEARLSFEANEGERAALAALDGLVELRSFAGEIEARVRSGGRVSIKGRAQARVVQTCVVSLEDFEAVVECPIEAEFVEPAPAAPAGKARRGVRVDAKEIDVDPLVEAPEEIRDGKIDVGALASEALTLSLDPHPRKPGATFLAPPEG